MGDKIDYQDIPWNRNVPQEIKDIVATWDGVWKSPYSLSLYDTPDKTWDVTPEGSLRVSDHWNFKDDGGKLHCATRGEQPRRGFWALCQYLDGAYVLIAQFRMTNTRKDRTRARKAKGVI